MSSVLVVDDDRTVRHLLSKALEKDGVEVNAVGSAEQAIQLVGESTFDAVVLDIVLPGTSGMEAFSQIRALDNRLPVIFMTARGTSDTAIEAMALGAYDYLLKPLDLPHVRTVVEQAIEIRRLMSVPVEVGESLSADDKGDQIVGRSAEMQEVFKAIGRVAPQDVTVLIRGESGTGKELVARAIYQHSRRAESPFLAVNCAAIPDNLLESELFGHEKGAFTGAETRRIGKFEQFSGGTIFLDEIGDMPSLLQSKILRLLQEQKFERVGGNQTIQTNVRIIAATNRDLETMVEDNEFREDLFYRINGYTIYLPPLRKRDDDIVLLLQHLLARVGRQIDKPVKQISPEALALLREYSWPGNIRELESCVRKAMLQTTGTVVVPEFLPPEVLRSQRPTSAHKDNGDLDLTYDLSQFLDQRLNGDVDDLYDQTLEMMERYLLTRVLDVTEGNQSEAARRLGITRGRLRNRIRSLGIKIGSVIDPGVEEEV